MRFSPGQRVVIAVSDKFAGRVVNVIQESDCFDPIGGGTVWLVRDGKPFVSIAFYLAIEEWKLRPLDPDEVTVADSAGVVWAGTTL